MLEDIVDPERLSSGKSIAGSSGKDGFLDLTGEPDDSGGLLAHTMFWTRFFAASGLYDWFLTNPLTMQLSWGDAQMGEKYRDFAAGFIGGLETSWFLDLPCGSGIFSLPSLARRSGLRVLAADYAPAMLRRYLRFAGREGLADNRFQAVRVDAADLPFRDSSVPACLSQNSLHAYPEPEAAVEELARVLEPGARFAMTVHVDDRGRTWFDRWVLGPTTGLPYHHRHSSEWLELLESHGLIPDQHRLESRYLWLTGHLTG